MRLPPPFLVLYGIKYVRIIKVSAAKKLGTHMWIFRGLWIQLKGSPMVFGFRTPGTGCQLWPFGMSPSFFRAVPSFGLVIWKMDWLLYLFLAMLWRSKKIIMGDNCGSVEKILKVRWSEFKFHIIPTHFTVQHGLKSFNISESHFHHQQNMQHSKSCFRERRN